MTTEKRTFQISANMIYHSIERQAGSIEKAILECLMNAVDGKATEVRVVLDANGVDYSIIDNGHGFRSRDEILKCFEVFGFDHGTPEENSRTYGAFGIGRAQLWAFSSNIWHTNEFKLDVDIKNKGINYDLENVNTPHQGCKIDGEFYETQTLADLQNIRRELTKLALYLPIDFYLNDKLISKKADESKWDHETKHAYVKFNDTGELKVYNLGVFVCAYSNYKFGKGGIVVSKTQLQLNTARNDILLSKCKVWKSVRNFVEDKATTDNLKKKVLDDNGRINLLRQWSSLNQLNIDDLGGKRLLPDVQGKRQTISALEKYKYRITVADTKGSQVGENIHNNKSAFVFDPVVLEWFDVDTVEELAVVLSTSINKDRASYCKVKIVVESFSELKKEFASTYIFIDPKKYTKKQKLFMIIAKKIGEKVYGIVRRYHGYSWNSEDYKTRNILLGANKNVLAWTNGSSYIAIEKEFIKVLDQGDRGIMKMINVIIHEYLHQNSSGEDHVHSHDFFEDFHKIILDKYVEINTLLLECRKSYALLLLKNDVALPREYIRQSNREKSLS